MGADNNLERYAIKNIASLQKVGTNSKTNILVLFDRSPGYDTTNDNWSGTKLLWITKNPSSLNADIVKDYGELDMTDSKNLYEFLEFTNEYFPAKHTVLDIWGHGRGVYLDGVVQSSKGVIEDYTTGYGADKTITIYDFAKAIKDYEDKYSKTIDIIQFDTCLMQSIEACWQLKNLTSYIVGTETETPANGSDYESIANFFTAIPRLRQKV